MESKRWTKERKENLVRMYIQGIPTSVIADKLDLTEQKVVMKLEDLGYIRK